MFKDFAGISNNEAYKRVFADRMMLPHPSDPGRFLGNTQREDFLPILMPIVQGLARGAQIFDFGCGGGEIVDIALKAAPSATIHLEEPNTLLLDTYRKRLQKYSHLSEGAIFNCPIEMLYHKEEASKSELPQLETQDLILDLHMIYHITNFTRTPIDASKDIIDMMSFQYSLLKKGGRIFMVYADDEICTTAQASRYYFRRKGQEQFLRNLESISQARSALLKNGGITEVLQKLYPQSKPQLNVSQTSSWVFGRTKRDMAILCLLAELGDSDERAFEVEKLQVCSEFIEECATGIRLSLETREIAQKGMWRFFQPQLILVLEKF